jgi:hypothetical protein
MVAGNPKFPPGRAPPAGRGFKKIILIYHFSTNLILNLVVKN